MNIQRTLIAFAAKLEHLGFSRVLLPWLKGFKVILGLIEGNNICLSHTYIRSLHKENIPGAQDFFKGSLYKFNLVEREIF